jgi:hypothetical protein
VCLCIPLIVARQRLDKNLPIVARQRLGRKVTGLTNTHATIEELLDGRFQCGPCRIKESRRFILPRTSCSYFNPDYLTSELTVTGLGRIYCISEYKQLIAFQPWVSFIQWVSYYSYNHNILLWDNEWSHALSNAVSVLLGVKIRVQSHCMSHGIFGDNIVQEQGSRASHCSTNTLYVSIFTPFSGAHKMNH